MGVTLPASVLNEIRAAQEALDMDRHQRALIAALAYAPASDVELAAYKILDEQPHETQLWWRQSCNCDGHLN